ncbi:hypothetical protein BPO_1592 [Bergeyella porcorum]|uniref:Uncharacterized protein n=1 Tax=Bergeyella porcorum TaxID=1735111 RepID=A0AAU0F2R4_9FLAO
MKILGLSHLFKEIGGYLAGRNIKIWFFIFDFYTHNLGYF